MNNIFETYDITILNYVKEHVKEIHLFSTDLEYQKSASAYLLLDDDSIIEATEYKWAELRLHSYLGTKADDCLTRPLGCYYPDLSIGDLGDNIIDHGLVEKDTLILETEAWSLGA